MRHYANETRNRYPARDREEDEAPFPFADEPEDMIHVYPTADGGVLFSPTELDPETPFILANQERLPQEERPGFLFPVGVLLLLGLIGLSLVLPTPTHEVSFSVSVPSVTLPQVTKTITVTTLATGRKTEPATTAHGILTLTNGSIIAQQVPAGLIVPGSVEVVTDAPVVVPAGSAEGFGVATVLAHALVSGASGNLPADAINSVEGTSLYIRNLQPFSGGKDAREIPSLTAQDVERAASSLVPPLQRHTLALLNNAVVLNPTCSTDIRSTPQVGQPTQRAIVVVRETCHAVSYRLSAVKTAITLYSRKVGAGTLSRVQFQIVEVTGGKVTLYVTALWMPIVVRPYPAER